MENKNVTMRCIYVAATEFYISELFSEDHKDKMEYIKSRGLSDETIRKFRIGYSGNSRRLWQKMIGMGFHVDDIMESGIFSTPDRDKFYGRITFPISDESGQVIAFTGRIIGEGDPKYLNSPASDIFDKRSVLYGLHFAKEEIEKSGSVIIVEGQMDTISLHQAGFRNAVGVSGSALTKDHLISLRKIAKTIFLCFDSDTAGVKATFSSLESIESEPFSVRIITMPNT